MEIFFRAVDVAPNNNAVFLQVFSVFFPETFLFLFLLLLTKLFLSIIAFPVVVMDGYIEGNGADHHTDKFKLTRNPGSVILRRGQSFKTKIELAREYNPDKDKFFFNLKTGKNPQTFSNSDITVQQATDKEFRAIKLRGKEWGFKIHTPTNIKEHHKYNVYCEIYIPPTAAVGKYSLTVESEDDCVFKFDNPIYILFNPWCTGRLCFLFVLLFSIFQFLYDVDRCLLTALFFE